MRQVQVQLHQTLQFISSEMEGVPTVVPSPLAGNTIPLFQTDIGLVMPQVPHRCWDFDV